MSNIVESLYRTSLNEASLSDGVSYDSNKIANAIIEEFGLVGYKLKEVSRTEFTFVKEISFKVSENASREIEAIGENTLAKSLGKLEDFSI